MEPMRVSLLLLALAAGCGSDVGGDDLATACGDCADGAIDLSASVDGGDDGNNPGPDMAQPPQDLSGLDLKGVFVCGQNICGSGQTCCAMASGGMLVGTCTNGPCADGGVPVQCAYPSECMGDPCCITVQSGAATAANCTNAANACVPNLNVGTQSGQTRGCTTNSDCTAGGITSSYPTCCTQVKYGVHLCFNSTLAGLSGGAFTCP
jgi:hypothetical protein